MSGQPSLFTRNGDAPLADRLRPKTLADYIGQRHILGDGMPLAVAIAQKKPFSMLLWGPPGCGKTTLALLLADAFDARYIRLSAVFSGVKEVREAVAQAQQERAIGRKTILFIDEIHRFNKAQQDAFLPYVEDGTLILIGATTENPAFNLNNALLSRLRVFHLKPLSEDELAEKLRRGLAALGLEADEPAIATLAYQAGGDARKAIGWLEEWALLRRQGIDSAAALAQALADQPKALDKQGDWFYELLSAFHKSLRGSNPDGAMYWFAHGGRRRRPADYRAADAVRRQRRHRQCRPERAQPRPERLPDLRTPRRPRRLPRPRPDHHLPRPRPEKQRQLQSDESRLCLRPREPRPSRAAAPAQRADCRPQKRRLRRRLPLRTRRTAGLRRRPNLPARRNGGHPLLPPQSPRL